jgi:ketosteroid isomerase-like protein
MTRMRELSTGVHSKMSFYQKEPSNDYVAICNALAAIARASDLGTVEEYMALMTDDIVFEFPSMPQLGLEAKLYKGLEQVEAGVISRRATGLQGPGSHTLHLLSATNVWSEGENTNRALTFWTYYADTHETPKLRSMGQYDNIFRKVGNSWRLAHRIISIC